MPPDLFAKLSALPPESVVLFLFIALVRPLGLMFGFVVFFWGMGASLILRVSIAVMLGLPMALAATDQIIGTILRRSLMEMVMILSKEVVLGLTLGLLVSLPFFALKAGGEIVDAFRGESDSGHTDPADGSISTLGTVFLILGFLIFLAQGGLWQVTGMLYRSYEVWAVTDPLPRLSAASALLVSGLVFDMLVMAVLVAAPLMLALFAGELLVIFAARLTPKFHLDQNEFLVKNLLTVLLLPLIILYVARLVDSQLFEGLTALQQLQNFLP